METRASKHYDEDTLELYAMGRLAEEAVPWLEEHLMLCRNCQLRLERTEEFLAVAQTASELGRQEQRKAPDKVPFLGWIFGLPKPVWAGAFALLALSLAIPSLYHPGNGNSGRMEVELRTSRGLSEDTPATVAPGRVVVVADVSELRQLPTYLVRLMDQSGSEVWKGTAQAVNQKVRQQISKPVGPGHYWVRIYSGDGLDLLREYALNVK